MSARPETRVSTDADRAAVRLVELVAAVSLGVDLGYGQPMEHVLIALRVAERLGPDDETRAGVYYTGSHAPTRAGR